MQTIKLTPQQPNIKGLIASDRTLILCDTNSGSFPISIPNGNSSVEREIIVKNIGINNLTVNFDYNSQLYVASGITIQKVVVPNESLILINDKLTGNWNQINASVSQTAKFGDIANGNYSEIESDGTLVFHGNATPFEDIGFPLIVKTTGTGRPVYAVYSGTLESLQWAINDVAQAVDNEIPHAHKSNSSMTWHVHFYTSVQDASDRYVKWEIAYTGSNYNAPSPGETVISAEIMIPANTPALTHFILNIGTYNPVDSPGFHIKARLKRIAASGTAPSSNPFCELMQLHFEKDGNGSRTITQK